ncbi:midasin-like [Impatiens glandulifera]|uniref:midasin-like n=1 Tax=Impatiens glandulifera TaxID=253017 RepID=UPI001FB05534|nr:midasin-like [Impatiens glandulifera]
MEKPWLVVMFAQNNLGSSDGKGSLTQADMNGYWVVFEDIDKAPSDVQSLLLPLLEGACLFSTGHGEAIRVPQGFRLFSTISSSKPDIALSKEGGSSLSNLWRRVMIESPSSEDLMCILKVRYSNLEPLAAKLIETLENINHLMILHTGNTASLSSFSRFTLRDLLKWCKRIAELNYYFDGDALPVDVCNSIYQEILSRLLPITNLARRRLVPWCLR